jgi:DNA (cytosine-5)-methyltransferase 1
MRKYRAIDLFCCAGGAAKGLHDAGFEVVGVDIRPQPRFPYKFILGNALDADMEGFDLAWASPPCQAHSVLKSVHKVEHECFIERTRAKLIASGLPYIMENVVGSPLLSPVTLCGSMFNLNVRRHRLFESNILLTAPDCNHKAFPEPLSVTGHFGKGSRKARKPHTLADAQRVMDIDWMDRNEIVQAIPPAYSEYLGRQIIKFLDSQIHRSTN